jgi:hypothetical protein
MAEDKKPIEEYLNLSLMNLVKAIDRQSGEMAVISDKLTTIADRLEKINWNLGTLAKASKGGS